MQRQQQRPVVRQGRLNARPARNLGPRQRLQPARSAGGPDAGTALAHEPSAATSTSTVLIGQAVASNIISYAHTASPRATSAALPGTSTATYATNAAHPSDLQPVYACAAGAGGKEGSRPVAIAAPVPPPSTSQQHSTAAATPSTPSSTTMLPVWGALVLLSLSYMHQACNSFSLPVMLPAISSELQLDDLQGAMLTTGFSYLYALVLLPVGMLCDRVPRPKLLAAGVAAWSSLTLLASNAQNFGELLAARIGFAAAQAVQNPISFALIPELFPANKSAALSLYNCAVYFGRALAFGATLAGAQMARLTAATAVTAGPAQGGATATAAAAAASGAAAAGVAAPMIFVPMDQVDLRLVQIVYTSGDYAAVMPTFSYSTFSGAIEDLADMDPSAVSTEAVRAVVAAAEGSWRDVLRWVALPGFAIALALVLALPEPRDAKAVGASGGGTNSHIGSVSGSSGLAGASEGRAGAGEGAGGTGRAAQQQHQHQATSGAHGHQGHQGSRAQDQDMHVHGGTHARSHSHQGSGHAHDPHHVRPHTQAHAHGRAHARDEVSTSAGAHASLQHQTPSAAIGAVHSGPAGFMALLRTPAFLLTTLAASFNDVGSYALVAWQSTFYERIHHLEPSQYAPVLAMVLPLGGIVGGVGGGWLADYVARGELARDPVDEAAAAAAAAAAGPSAGAGRKRGKRGKAAPEGRGGVSRRAWVTVGASLAAAPALLVSMTTPDHEQSYLALLVGFALSEAWRAPAANMARSVAPAEMGSSASALYLCIRNLVGGLGPISVALLSQRLGLQQGLLLVPLMYLVSGGMFWVAEQQFVPGAPGTAAAGSGKKV